MEGKSIDDYVFDKVKTEFYPKFIEEEKHVVFYKALTWYHLFIEYDTGLAFIYSVFGRAMSIPLCDVNKQEEARMERCFGKLLQIQMKHHGVGQVELATRLNTTQTMISRYITGKAVPSYLMLKQIADAIGCTVDELYLPVKYSRKKHRLL